MITLNLLICGHASTDPFMYSELADRCLPILYPVKCNRSLNAKPCNVMQILFV